MKIGEALREVRLNLGLSQAKMCEGIVQRPFYALVESGKSGIRAESLIMLLIKHEVDINYFYNLVMDSYVTSETQIDRMLQNKMEYAVNSKNIKSINYYKNKIVVDSWNNIKKYAEIKGAFFLLDEDRVTGSGAWVKAFLKIAKNNDWIILSATPGDTYMDYWAVFVANGFYKNKTEFQREHVVYSRFAKFPQIERYIGTQRLDRLRNRILIDMTVQRHTKPHHEDVYCNYDVQFYKDIFKRRWNPFKDEPVQQASSLCYVLRRIVNSDESRQVSLLELLEDHPKAIIFYNFDYEREILLNLGYAEGTKIAEWSGHAHQPVPTGSKWIYLTQYTSGCEGWNCITTDTIIFYSQNYSYKVMTQAAGRIDRLNTKFIDLYYYHLKSRASIDIAISRALKEKKQFNETRWLNKWIT